MNIINKERPFIADAMTIENAISTIMKKLELSSNQSKLLLGELCEQKISQKEKHNIQTILSTKKELKSLNLKIATHTLTLQISVL